MINLIKHFLKELFELINNIFNINNNTNINKPNYNKDYIKKEYLLTQTELRFYKILRNITDELDLTVCPQVALYEIVKNKNFKDFSKIASKTIDFVICEQNLKIKLCIELDDYTHNREKRKQRDIFINNLFKDTNIKILRINVQNFYNKENLKKEIESLI